MTRKKIKLLTSYCYDDALLNEKKVFTVAKYLNKADLKKFLKELKAFEERNSVIITIPFETYDREFFKKYFPHKNIIFKYDPNLFLGIKIEYNDDVYEFNLKNILEKESSFVKSYYD